MTLPNDMEAFQFGERLVRDLASAPEQHVGLALAIIKNRRTVRSIPVE
jgi:hypothetical protein